MSISVLSIQLPSCRGVIYHKSSACERYFVLLQMRKAPHYRGETLLPQRFYASISIPQVSRNTIRSLLCTVILSTSPAHRLSSNSISGFPSKPVLMGEGRAAERLSIATREKRVTNQALLSEPVREANGCAACEDARQVLHALDEPLDLPAADHDLVNLLDNLTQKNRMRMHTVMHSHPIFCPNLSTKGPNQVFFQSCLMNTWQRGWEFLQLGMIQREPLS